MRRRFNRHGAAQQNHKPILKPRRHRNQRAAERSFRPVGTFLAMSHHHPHVPSLGNGVDHVRLIEQAGFRRGQVAMRTYESPDLKIARAMASGLRGRWSVLEFRWMIARAHQEIERFAERHELFLATDEEIGAALAAAGLEARKEPEGFGRGLWIGRKVA